MTNLSRSLILGCSVLALAACGPEDIASPGSGGDIIINNPPGTPAPSPTPTPGAGGVTPAAACPTIADPTGLVDVGTITGPTGTWRVCELPRVIRASTTLPRVPGVLYQMNGRVDVGCDGGFVAPTGGAPHTTSTRFCPTTSLTSDTNVTLTIDPGVILFASTGQSWLAVNRGNKINAVGTSTQPIIFTSRQNVLGQNTNESQGQWGGVVLMGRAVTTDCTNGSVVSNTCERQTEGAADPAVYGGTQNNDSSGQMSFVQIRYSGFTLSATSELQALTTESIGSGTVLDHIQSVNSSDDGAEFFGGHVNMKYYISVGADDDSLDVDTGAQMNLQYAILAQRPGRGDGLMEIDSNGNPDDAPRTVLRVANFTAIQPLVSSDNEASGNTNASTLFRGNSDTTLINGIINTPNNQCIRMNGSASPSTPATLIARSVVMTCSGAGDAKYIGTGSLTASQVRTAFGAGTNNNRDDLTSTLTNMFVNGAQESAVLAVDPKTFSAFFDTTNYVGAVSGSAATWYQGWTCNTTEYNFGSSNTGACTSLPVYS